MESEVHRRSVLVVLEQSSVNKALYKYQSQEWNSHPWQTPVLDVYAFVRGSTGNYSVTFSQEISTAS